MNYRCKALLGDAVCQCVWWLCLVLMCAEQDIAVLWTLYRYAIIGAGCVPFFCLSPDSGEKES